MIRGRCQGLRAASLLWLLLPMAGNAASLKKLKDGVLLSLPGHLLRVQVMSDAVIRVASSRDMGFFSRESLSVVGKGVPTWTLSSDADTLALHTSRLQAVVDRKDGRVRFLDPSGKPVLEEALARRTLEAARVQGEKTWHVGQQWSSQAGESLYGLGQRQYGGLDIKGQDLDLWQRNTNVVIPFLVSSQGYGIYWDNTSYTRFGDLREFGPIPAELLFDRQGQPGGLSQESLSGSGQVTRSAEVQILPGPKPEPGQPRPRVASQRWQGSLLAPATGDFQLRCRSNGGIKIWVDGALQVEHWRQSWLTDIDQVTLHLEQGKRYSLKVEWNSEQGNTLQLSWKTPNPGDNTSLWSEVGEGTDYYFVYGPGMDQVLAGYRLLTGKAPMMPSWAFGLWQSRQRYETAAESLDVVKQFRRLRVPFDAIVQDWQYWPKEAWGSHQFDAARFPDPDAWIRALHGLNAHLMVSVWGKYYPGTENFRQMQARGYLYQPNLEEGLKDWIGFPYTFYDAFDPGARKLFWQQLDSALFRKGVDAWWMDATEPDLMPSPPTLDGGREHMHPTALGSGARMLNAYPLMNSKGVYEGQRASAPDQRVFILTRSGFGGQQRYAGAVWSGDVSSTWTALARQIPAGLSFSLSGLPYWTTDIGGYAVPGRFMKSKGADEEEWRELNVRWFQFGAFCPLFRVHGEGRPREIWNLGGPGSPAYQAELKFDRLRYRLFPYIYSTAADASFLDSTFMRPLVMDFQRDLKARGVVDEYLFGGALLVAPVTVYRARSRSVYLPEGVTWYDFWTGKAHAGGRLEASAPYDQIPLFARAGSILPLGPERQYVAELPSDPITLYVYAGADGDFSLYEDEGTNNNYEKGAFSRIKLHWNDAGRVLEFGERKGSFPGMLSHRTFEVLLVSPGKPTGFSSKPKPTARIEYDGKPVNLSLEMR